MSQSACDSRHERGETKSMRKSGSDDQQTLHRRARLRELVDQVFDGSTAALIRHVENTKGVSPNLGELGRLQKDNSGQSFGEKRARTLCSQIGLSSKWFDMPLGSNATFDTMGIEPFDVGTGIPLSHSTSQALLLRIRKDCCGGSNAELGRKINKDSSYVARLLMPEGSKGAKRIGLEIMRACTLAFSLPIGFWDGRDPGTLKPDTIEHLFERLGNELQACNDINRDAVAALLANLAKHPSSHRDICASIKALLAVPKGS